MQPSGANEIYCSVLEKGTSNPIFGEELVPNLDPSIECGPNKYLN